MQCGETASERMTRKHSGRDCFTSDEWLVHGGSVPSTSDTATTVTPWRDFGRFPAVSLHSALVLRGLYVVGFRLDDRSALGLLSGLLGRGFPGR
jgi:hypothetical protein